MRNSLVFREEKQLDAEVYYFTKLIIVKIAYSGIKDKRMLCRPEGSKIRRYD